MDKEEQAEVYAEVGAIYDAIDKLTVDEAEALDMSALEEAAAFFTRQIMPLNEESDDKLDLADGSIVITATGYKQGDATEETAYTGEYVISQASASANSDDGDATSSTTNTITVTGGTHNITLNGVNIDVSRQATLETACAFAITGGKVTLTLAEDTENTLKSGVYDDSENYGKDVSFAGLWVKQDASLTIMGSGSLTATAGGEISGAYNVGGGAGIGANGGGRPNGEHKAYYTAGDITISGGTITATGDKGTSYGGPGIGGGSNASNITISGGTVTAKSGKADVGSAHGSAGIGKVYGFNGAKTILISGGTVTAEGCSAGIGGGDYQSGDVITITGGTVTATAKQKYGAGIGDGGGKYHSKDNNGGVITISGGTVTATGGIYGAGIGGGGMDTPAGISDYSGGGSGTITISGGTVNATGGQYAPGIGSGSIGALSTDTTKTAWANGAAMGVITITGGTVTATNGSDFPGTGDGAGSSYTIGNSTVTTGIGQGLNAGSEAKTAFANWALQTEFGDALALVADSQSVTSLTRNGESYTPGKLVSGETTCLILPEGYYDELKDTDNNALLVTADTDGKSSADTLITSLNAVDLDKTGDDLNTQINSLKTYEQTYNGLSETLQYYVDKSVNEGKTLAELKESLAEKNVSVNVTLNANGGTLGSTSTTVTYGSSDYTFAVPTKANYDFDGWYLGETKITGSDGKGLSKWNYISDTTLTARWVSEIKGEGTESSPYELKSAANFIALSHISAGIGTAEEFALFGKTATDANTVKALLSSHYKLVSDVTLKTEDGFYGIGFEQIYYKTGSGTWANRWDYTFNGTFDGDNHTITLDIDTSKTISVSTDPNVENDLFNGKVQPNDDTYVIVSGGLFNKAGYTNTSATIQNVKTAGSVTLAMKSNSCGVLIGVTAGDVTVENCENSASLTVGATFNTSPAGGLIGQSGGASLTVKNCKNTGAITAGAALTLLDNSTTLSQGNALAGGIVSTVSSTTATFEDCENTGAITATRQTELESHSAPAGGIVGYVGATTASFTNCKNSGTVSATAQSNNNAGGIVGRSIESSVLTFSGCENSGSVTAAHGGAAGMILSGGTVWGKANFTNCSHVMTATDAEGWKLSDNSASVADGALKVPVTSDAGNYFNTSLYVVNAAGVKSADLFSADGATLYADLTHNGNVADDALPYQSWSDAYVIRSLTDYENLVKAIADDETAQAAVLGGRMSGADATTKAVALSKAYVKLAADLTLTGDTAIGLGTAVTPFSGKIDGQSNTVTFNINSSEWKDNQPQYIGLVGYSDGTEVSNVSFAGSVALTTATTNGENLYIGPAVACGNGATVSDCSSTVSVTATHSTKVQNATGGYLYAGGLIGSQTGASVTNCQYTGDISVTAPKFAMAGGVGGSLTASAVSNCTAKGNIKAELKYDSSLPVFGEESAAGGIAGEMSGSVENCVAVGTVSASNDSTRNYAANAGGLAGKCTGALTVKDCMAFTTVSATRTGHTSNDTYLKKGALTGTPDQMTLTGTNWAVKTTDIEAVAGVNTLDTTALDGGTFGDSKTLCSATLPDGLTLASDIAELSGTGAVSYTKAGSGTITLAYDGQDFFTSENLTVSALALTSESVTITGVNSSYVSDEAAAKADIQVVYNGTVLVKDTDYTVTQDMTNHKFTISFTGNYSGTAEASYSVNVSGLDVTAEGYTGVYDAENHSITVNAPEGATVTYGTEANTLSDAKVEVKNAGTTVVYWKVESGEHSVTGSAVISISPAPLTITADDKSVYVGGTLPEFTYMVSGLKKGDNLTTVPTLTCSATDTNTVGNYTIKASGANAGENYTITYVDGTLTISNRSGGGGGGTTTYAVTVDSTKNGSVSVSPKNASKGTTVTITVKPDSGYELDDLTVTDKNGSAVKLTKKSDTQYTFTMPTSKVTVEASFAKIGEQPEVAFVDVSTGTYYYDAVAWAVENGVTSGTSATTFSPDTACTRAQAVTFLWRAAGSPAPKSSVNPFTDVPASAYYYNAVLWAVEQGITVGTSATTFSPDTTCTRGQIVTFLFRAVGTTTSGTNPFVDVADSAYYADAVKWAVAESVTAGTSASTFSPDASCTRAQIVTFLYRAYA